MRLHPRNHFVEVAPVQYQSPLHAERRSDARPRRERQIIASAGNVLHAEALLAATDHAFPKGVAPTVFTMCTAIAPIPASGVKAITVPDIRWQWCHIKAITLLANVLQKQQAVEEGCVEAIMHRDGFALEGATSNLFVLVNGILLTPPKDNDILPGITRDLVVEIAQANGIVLEQRKVLLEELRSAEEVWLTSSTREVLPVIELDGQQIGKGQPGPLWIRMNALYQERKELLRKGL